MKKKLGLIQTGGLGDIHIALPIALFYLYYKTLQVIYDIPSQTLEHFNNFITTDITKNIIPSSDEIKRTLLSDFYEILDLEDPPKFNNIDTGKETHNELLSNLKIINNIFKTLPDYHQ